MKTLLILRHGKAESYHEDGDKARALNPRGRRDAECMGSMIGDLTHGVDAIIASDAKRAEQTARIAAEAAEFVGDIEIVSQIYEADLDTLLALVANLPETLKQVVIVGHNPGLTELCAFLTGKTSYECSLATAGLARIKLQKSWQSAAAATGKLDGLWSPNDL